jgi:4-cresol dehydrogenase (hydroxylating)
VRWFDLYEAIRAGGHKLMMSIADIGWGSVIGNTLDNGITYMPHGQDQMMQCGMEVVLANGDVMRTGMGAMPTNRAWHVYKRGLGPTPDQLFMQSNYGIVTKMGVWLLPYPETFMPVWVRVWRDNDLAPVLDTLRRLMLDGTVRGVPQVLNTLLYTSMFTTRDQWWQGEGPIPDDRIDEMAREFKCGRRLLRCGLYGDERVVDHGFEKIQAAFGAIPGADVWGTKCAPDNIPELENPHERVMGGVPSLDLNQMVAWYGGEEGGHIAFPPIAPLTGRDGFALRDLLRGMVETAGLDYMASLLPISARSFSHITMIIYDRTNEQQVTSAFEVCKSLVRKRPRVHALLRDDQGRPRSPRHSLPGQAGYLAALDAR